MVLGQILTNVKNVETNEFVYVTNDKTTLNNKIPTLIVGKNNAKEIIGENNMKYLNKRVSDTLFWTFGKTEKRDEYEKDIKIFNDMIISRLIKNVEYKYTNLFTSKLEDIKYLLKILKNNDKKVYLVIDNTMYIYYNKDNVIYGISLLETDYIGISRKKIYKYIDMGKNVTQIKNQYSVSKKIRNTLKNCVYLIPYIYFLEKESSFQK